MFQGFGCKGLEFKGLEFQGLGVMGTLNPKPYVMGFLLPKETHGLQLAEGFQVQGLMEHRSRVGDISRPRIAYAGAT